MTEKGYFVYEWEYNETLKSFMCVGQVFIMGVQFDEEDEGWVGVCWDSAPSDPRWGDDAFEICAEALHPTVEQALDWCEEVDIREAEYDAAQFESGENE